jgi:hypothetical protein
MALGLVETSPDASGDENQVTESVPEKALGLPHLGRIVADDQM